MRIDIAGAIVPDDEAWIYDLLEIQATSPSAVIAAIAENPEGERLDVHIDSYGGSLVAGTRIYSELRRVDDLLIHIDGLAASAASLIAMAGPSTISPAGALFLHLPFTAVEGDYHAMQHGAEELQSMGHGIALAYAEKAALTVDEAKDLMEAESWITADRAVELGLVDAIERRAEDEPEPDLAIAAAAGPLLSAATINLFRERQCSLISDLEQLETREREEF